MKLIVSQGSEKVNDYRGNIRTMFGECLTMVMSSAVNGVR